MDPDRSTVAVRQRWSEPDGGARLHDRRGAHAPARLNRSIGSPSAVRWPEREPGRADLGAVLLRGWPRPPAAGGLSQSGRHGAGRCFASGLGETFWNGPGLGGAARPRFFLFLFFFSSFPFQKVRKAPLRNRAGFPQRPSGNILECVSLPARPPSPLTIPEGFANRGCETAPGRSKRGPAGQTRHSATRRAEAERRRGTSPHRCRSRLPSGPTARRSIEPSPPNPRQCP